MHINKDFCYHEVSGKKADSKHIERSVQISGRFRILCPGFSTIWFPDTFPNRKSMLMFLRSLQDKENKQLYTHQELSVIVDSENRQACSRHIEDFRASGEDMLAFLTPQRKVDSEVVEAVLLELKKEPLAEVSELCNGVKKRINREDIKGNIRTDLN